MGAGFALVFSSHVIVIVNAYHTPSARCLLPVQWRADWQHAPAAPAAAAAGGAAAAARAPAALQPIRTVTRREEREAGARCVSIDVRLKTSREP